jgi:hypothetical protein
LKPDEPAFAARIDTDPAADFDILVKRLTGSGAP